jgi:hypothetical protein
MYRKISSVAVLIIFLILPYKATAEEMTVRSYRSGIVTRNKETFENYVGGIGIGVFYASLFNVSQLGQKPIFCPPQRLKISGYVVIDSFNDYINNAPIDVEDYAVGVVMPFALQKTFPCN